jgi:hypothetical protein
MYEEAPAAWSSLPYKRIIHGSELTSPMATFSAHTIAIRITSRGSVHVAKQLASKNRNAIFLSTVTVAELMFGALRSLKPQEIVVICR